jgi:hypothetical protein
MKTKFQLMALCLTLLIAGVTSCKKEGVIVPQATATDSAQTMAVTGSNNNLRGINAWLLTKQGNNVLTYSATNKLQKVTYADGSVISYNYGFTNGANFIAGECVKAGKSLYKVTYFIDATGKAYQMKYKSDLSDMTYNFIYQNGRLVEQKSNYGAETCKFLYDVQNRLSTINFYGSDGIKKEVIHYAYGNQPPIDNNPINPEAAFLDRYLPIFGSFSKHLPVWVTPLKKPNFLSSDIEYQYIYQINAFGLVSQRNKYKIDKTTEPMSITLSETAKYEYMQK